MNADTKTALDNAIQNHVAHATNGAYLTDYFIICAATEAEDFGTGRTIYMFLTNESQPPHVSMGLLAYASDYGSPTPEEDDDN